MYIGGREMTKLASQCKLIRTPCALLGRHACWIFDLYQQIFFPLQHVTLSPPAARFFMVPAVKRGHNLFTRTLSRCTVCTRPASHEKHRMRRNGDEKNIITMHARYKLRMVLLGRRECWMFDPYQQTFLSLAACCTDSTAAGKVHNSVARQSA